MKYVIDLKNELDFIYKLQSNDVVNTLFKNKSLLKKKRKKFILETNKKINTSSSSFRFQNIDNEIVTLNDSANLKILSSKIKSSNGYDQSTFSIYKFCSESFNDSENIFYRLVLPYDQKIKIRYFDFFSNNQFMMSVNNAIFGGIEFNLETYTFKMYDINDVFVIECSSQINFELFDQYCRTCLASFGFITGFVPMDEGYYFGYKDFDDKFIQFLFSSTFYGTYKSSFSLVTTNSYEFYQNQDLDFSYSKEKVFEQDLRITEIETKLKSIERKVFENMIILMLKSEKFSETIYSLLSINNLKSFSVYLKAGLYTIVLEMITSIISKENNKNQKVPEDILKKENKKLREELQKKIHDTAKSFFEEHGLKYDMSIVEKRLNGIYTPINQDKLIEAYKLLGINLSSQDIKNIKTRNKFLHGSMPFKEKDFEILSKKLFYIALELNYLVHALIYKYIGYDGILKNLSKIYLDYTKIDELNEEDYYKDLQDRDI